MAIIINGQGRVGVRVAAPSGGGGASYLLDTYGGAAAAYSLRKLSSTYSGNAIRVRRSSDNTEQNIGFDGSGNLDTTALTSFVGAGNGFVTTWYDQSGNGTNMVSSTASRQGKIVSSGVVETSNSKPAINTIGINVSYRPNLNGSNTYVDYKTFFAVGQATTTSYSPILSSGDWYELISVNDPWASYTGKYMFSKHDSSTPYPGSPYVGGRYYFLNGATTNQFLLYGNMRNMNVYGSKNGDSETLLGTWGTTMRADQFLYGGTAFTGKFSEITFYNSDKSANKTSIESNINTFYSIY